MSLYGNSLNAKTKSPISSASSARTGTLKSKSFAFLTLISPLVALTYCIDKINDGQAQGFNRWLKEYIFNLLIQPMHLILYMILIGSAMRFAANNIFYVVIYSNYLCSRK